MIKLMENEKQNRNIGENFRDNRFGLEFSTNLANNWHTNERKI